jgi:hypothetical protein
MAETRKAEIEIYVHSWLNKFGTSPLNPKEILRLCRRISFGLSRNMEMPVARNVCFGCNCLGDEF